MKIWKLKYSDTNCDNNIKKKFVEKVSVLKFWLSGIC